MNTDVHPNSQAGGSSAAAVAHGGGKPVVPGIDEDELRRRVAQLTVSQRCELLTGKTAWRLNGYPEIGLEEVVVSDGPAGVRGTGEHPGETSVSFPVPSALAATWDVRLARRQGFAFAAEARRHGCDCVLAPVVNLQRSPVGGRHFEFFSEDPLLSGDLGCAVVEGMQEVGVSACVKHFVANETETLRTEYVSRLDERTLREVYLAPFERIVRDAGAWSIMASYNQLDDGTESAPAVAHHHLLTGILKGEWGFDGVVVSDWTATKTTLEPALGGLDLVMPGPAGPWSHGQLLALVESGAVPLELIDDKSLRILRWAARVGCFEELPDHLAGPRFTTLADDSDFSRYLAARSVVVLEDREDLLPWPVNRPVSSIALIGPNAVDPYIQGGGSSHVDPDVATVIPADDAFLDAFPGAEITLHQGADARLNPPELDFARATDPATGAPGVRIDALDDTGTVLTTTTVTSWDGMITEQPDGTTTVRVTADIALSEPGEHEIGLATVGAHRITIDGTLIDESTALAGGEVFIDSSVNTPPNYATTVQVPTPGSDDALTNAEAPTPSDEGTETGSAAADDSATVSTIVRLSADLQYIRTDEWGGHGFARVAIHHRLPGPNAEEMIAEAVAAAKAADLAVVVVGTNADYESEGWDRSNLDLPGNQNDLVEAVLAARSDAIVVVNAGAPVLLPWLERAHCVLWAWFPGQSGMSGVADALAGRVEPAGRLPWTLPARFEDVPVPNGIPDDDGVIDYREGLDLGYRSYLRRGVAPARPFGFGLGWTTWDYGEPRVVAHDDDGVTIELTIRNGGVRPGHETVQAYVSTGIAAPARPVRWLGAATVVDAAAGERVTARLRLPRRVFEVWDPAAHEWTLPEGEYTISLAHDLDDIRSAIAVSWPRPIP
ncbi:MAG: glycoside hydrolase family 3 C-terminal domain-containing protein [Propionibacteriaceae bacterium]|jgi:beta-glucosidase|nr:glycoside hydrolase family 3 C-terminal domain-containing protein [Propionibacteriaceae bacterium]